MDGLDSMAWQGADRETGVRGADGGGDGAPIDRSHLARYTLGDPVLEREVMSLFLAQLPLTIESLKFAASDKDWHMAAHTLKGSGRAVGAWQLAQLARKAEEHGFHEGASAQSAIVADIERAASEIEAYVSQSLQLAVA